jgi:hypothetical protein
VLEPIFEADFLPCPIPARSGGRIDAIAEIHMFGLGLPVGAGRGYRGVLSTGSTTMRP